MRMSDLEKYDTVATVIASIVIGYVLMLALLLR